MKLCSLRLLSCGSCRHPEFMTKKGGRLCAVDFPSFVGVLVHPDEGLILFDTGYDQAFFEATESFPERFYRWMTPIELGDQDNVAARLAHLGYKTDDVRIIIISHFHGDHVSGLHNFPNAKIFCSKAGLKSVHDGSRFKRVRKGFLTALVPDDSHARSLYFEDGARQRLPEDFHPFTDGADLLKDGSLLAIELPGHCPGHWGLALRLEDSRYAFLIGDAAWSLDAVERNMPPPGMTTKILGDTGRYRETLGALHILKKVNRDVVILPSHCFQAAHSFQREADDADL